MRWGLCGLVLFAAACGAPYLPPPQAAGPPLRVRIPKAQAQPVLPTWGGPREKISLAGAVQRALSRGWEAALARAEVQVALARYEREEVAWLPVLALGGGVARTEGRVQGSFGRLRDVDFVGVGPGLVLRLAANPLAQAARIQAARHGAERALYGARRAREALILRVVELYEELRFARAAAQAASREVAASERLLRLARNRVRAGVGRETEVTRAEARLARDRRRLVEFRELWARRSVALQVVLRGRPEVLLVPEEGPAPWGVTGAEEAPGPEGRGDLLARQAERQAREAAAQAALWELAAPQVELFGEQRWIGSRWGNAARNLHYGAALLWELSWEKLKAVRVRRAEAERARLQVARAREAAEAEVAAARQALAAARERLVPAREAVSAARRALEVEEAAYGAGTVDLVSVLAAREALARAELALYRVIADANEAWARYLFALGQLREELFAPGPEGH